MAVIETVIDDSSPQLLAYVSELLREAGAWDVYRVAVQMKKGRAGVQLTVLCNPGLVPALRDLIFRETTTIGLHWRLESKTSLAREFAEVQTPWGPVQIKIARWGLLERSQMLPLNTKTAAPSPAKHRRAPQTGDTGGHARLHLRPREERDARMNRTQIETLLNEVSAGRSTVPEALERLRDLPFEDLGFAKVDHHRALRTGHARGNLCGGKDIYAGGRNLCAHGHSKRQRPRHACLPRSL